jgi:hypothetical protein
MNIILEIAEQMLPILKKLKSEEDKSGQGNLFLDKR